jgi:SlyX protein
MDENRLIELETKIAHQELAIENLQNGFHEQSMLIDKLQKALKLLKESFESAGEPAPRNEKPPHY